MNRSKTKTDAKRWGIALVISIAIALAIEVCVFNYQSIETLFLPSGNASIGEQSADTVSLDFSEANVETVPVTGSVSTLSFTTDSDSPIPLDISATD